MFKRRRRRRRRRGGGEVEKWRSGEVEEKEGEGF